MHTIDVEIPLNVTISYILASDGESSSAFVILKTIIVVIITLLIISTNFINLIVLYRMHQLPRVARMFLLNLSFSDLLLGIIACGPAMYTTAKDVWPFGDFWCQFAGVIHGVSITISIWSIAVIGVDRYIAVTKPFIYATLRASAKFYVILVVQWFAAIVTFLIPNFTKHSFSYYKYNHATSMCGLYWEYKAFCVVTGVYIPILSGSILIFTSIQITRKLKENSLKHVSKQRRTRTSTTRQTLRILLATGAIYFSCWFPYVMIVYIEAFSGLRTADWVHFVVLWLANSNSMMNVFIYSTTNPAFRKTLFDLLYCRRQHRIHVSSRADESTSEKHAKPIGTVSNEIIS